MEMDRFMLFCIFFILSMTLIFMSFHPKGMIVSDDFTGVLNFKDGYIVVFTIKNGGVKNYPMNPDMIYYESSSYN